MSEPRRVLVVGGGAGGVVTAAALLRQAHLDATDVDVTVVERAAVVGPGLAYGTTEPHHLLNNYAEPDERPRGRPASTSCAGAGRRGWPWAPRRSCRGRPTATTSPGCSTTSSCPSAPG